MIKQKTKKRIDQKKKHKEDSADTYKKFNDLFDHINTAPEHVLEHLFGGQDPEQPRQKPN